MVRGVEDDAVENVGAVADLSQQDEGPGAEESEERVPVDDQEERDGDDCAFKQAQGWRHPEKQSNDSSDAQAGSGDGVGDALQPVVLLDKSGEHSEGDEPDGKGDEVLNGS